MISKSDLKKPLSSLSKYRQEQVKKYRQQEEEERLEVLGGDSEIKALPWVQKDVDDEQKKDREYFYLLTDLLQNHTNNKKVYLRLLSQIFLHFAAEEWIPKKYFIEVDLNDIGMVVSLKGTSYYGAFKPSGLPSYDFRYCQILAVKLGNTVAKLEGHYQKSEHGVILPDGEDLKTYG